MFETGVQSTLVISNLVGPSETLRDIRISTYQIFRIAENTNRQINFTNEYVIRLLYLEIYIENIVEKGRNCSRGAISPLIDNILLPYTWTRFSYREKRLFEISEVEITRVDCSSS